MEQIQSTVPKLRFGEFKDLWSLVQLGEIGSFKNGLNKGSEDFGFGSPFINLLDVFGKIEIDKPELNLVNASKRDLETYSVHRGDVFFIRSSVKRSAVGETVVAKSELKNTVYSGFLIRYRTNDRLTNDFKRYCFWTEEFRRLLIRFSTTSANTNINQESLQQLTLRIPSSDEQQKIADFLSAVDKKIGMLKEKHTLLIQYKKGVMQKLFSQEIRFKDDTGKDFPDWQEKHLSQVLDIQVREIAKPTEKYLALGIRSHMKGTFQKPNFDPEKIMMDKLFIVRPNDLIVNITFAWEGAVAIAKSNDDGGLVSHRFPTYTFKDGESTHKYFKHVITLKRFKYMLDLISPGGAGRNRVLSKKEFLKLKWNLPSVGEQLKIAGFLDALDSKVELVSEQIVQTQTFKKGLLQQMFV